MYRLLEFFYQYRAFLFFVLLEILSIWMIVQNNTYQGAAFLNSANSQVGKVLETKSNIQGYFELRKVNEQLASENAKLKQIVTSHERSKDLQIENKSDFLKVNQYYFVPAKVVSNSTGQYNNYITINRGLQDGIKEGMGVVSSNGVVGKVRKCSDHFCTCFSLLHKKFLVSGKIKGKGIECNVKWEGGSPLEAALLDVTRNHKIVQGDTVVTSGYNTFFPEGIMVGKIKDIKLEGGSFWRATVDLSTDFTSLSYVYVIGNKLEAEQDSLERVSTNKYNEEQ